MAIKIKDSNGKWITLSQDALETPILDLNNNFDSKNVEGALEELAELCRTEQDSEEIRALIRQNSGAISGLNERLADAEEDIAYLKENGGGGGGGTALPTITSTFVDAVIEKGKDVEIPIFFSSPNMGSGTAYILINNIEVDTVGVSQGNNVIFVKSQYLTATENLVGIYVKDRAGIVSNQLTWNIVCGGIELTTTFDYEVDYGVTDSIRIPYNIETGILTEKPILHITIDGIEQTYESKIGDNFIDISASTIGLGTHSVTMEATIGIYRSKKIIFNIVVVSTNELYLSTTFASGQQLPYGVPIQIDYRLSKASTESFNVRLSIDGTLVKTQTLTVGSYYWTIQSLDEGFHSLEIMVTNMDYSETKSITIDLEVVIGEYIPIEDYKLGLLCDLNATGKNNEDDNVDIWRDESGNGHDGQLVNFNFGTNGFINDWLICDNNAYVVIPWSPWFDNAVNGSTIDIIYEPINSGLEDSRVIDYTQITDNLSSDEIKPFKGVFANPLMATASSASSGLTSSKVNLDDESGIIHLTISLDYVQLDPLPEQTPEEKPEEKPEDKPEEKPEETTKWTGTVINTDVLRIRKGPGTEHPIVGYLSGGDRVEITEKKANGSMIWGKISGGWISLDYVRLDDTGEDADPTQTGKVRVEDVLRIRKGPGTSYAVVGYLQNGDAVEILERRSVGSSEWGRIEAGWISLSYVEFEKAEADPKPEKQDVRTVDTECLRIRSKPGTENAVVGYLYRGDKVTILETKAHGSMQWGRIKTGWISLDYVK